MERRGQEADQEMAQCSPSAPMALVSRISTISWQVTLILSGPTPTAAEPVRMPLYYCRATGCMERQTLAVVLASARCSQSTLIARAFQTRTVYHAAGPSQ